MKMRMCLMRQWMVLVPSVETILKASCGWIPVSIMKTCAQKLNTDIHSQNKSKDYMGYFGTWNMGIQHSGDTAQKKKYTERKTTWVTDLCSMIYVVHPMQMRNQNLNSRVQCMAHADRMTNNGKISFHEIELYSVTMPGLSQQVLHRAHTKIC